MYYRMVMNAYTNQSEYQQLYWSMNGYVPPPRDNTTTPLVVAPGPQWLRQGGSSWQPRYTAGGRLR
jgi:hypothetical protein